jgi:LAO/AO transport system kinase
MSLEHKSKALKKIDFKTLSRSISYIENETPGYEDILTQLTPSEIKIIGITGAPGSGKSTLTDALIGEMIKDNRKVGVLCVDPSSPFHHGALLGDRIRMSQWYSHPDVFIRSLASKGSLGGLHPKIIEISDIMKRGPFDYIIIETVGVGQSEVDIAALADITIVVLVPEGGDVIQTMKAGLIEVADIFVINKYDRPEANVFYNSLKQMLAPAFHHSAREIPVLKTIASQNEGINELYSRIRNWKFDGHEMNKLNLMTEKVWSLIQSKKMKGIKKEKLKKDLEDALSNPEFNLYNFAGKYTG